MYKTMSKILSVKIASSANFVVKHWQHKQQLSGQN